jgi:uncharacterized membrane protein YqjE
MASSQTNRPTGEESIPELTRRLSDETTRLVRAEVELAKAELAAKGKQVGVGAGMFGGAGLLGLYALGALTAAVILALTTAVAGWLAALIVAVVYAAVAGVLALRGKSQVQSATPPVPERAVESVKEDVEWTKQRVKSAKQ